MLARQARTSFNADLQCLERHTTQNKLQALETVSKDMRGLHRTNTARNLRVPIHQSQHALAVTSYNSSNIPCPHIPYTDMVHTEQYIWYFMVHPGRE